LPLDDAKLICDVIADEPLVVALPLKHPLLKSRRITLASLASEPFILYPARPRPSYADHVLQQFREHGLGLTAVIEVNEMQTAIGLVAANVGVTLVPSSVQRLRRDDVVYRALADKNVTSPVIMNRRAEGASPDLLRFQEFVHAQTAAATADQLRQPRRSAARHAAISRA
jgi:DNA-binding transcriptional LysR family regulator